MIQPLLRWRRGSRASAPFQFPLAAPARVAVLEGGLALDRNAREFAPADWEAMQAWAPEAIVAPLEVALSLAEKKLRGMAALSNLTAAVVLTDIDGEALSEHGRELLWKAFGVPVFEQLRSREGAIVARECEVHDGLHLDPEARVARELGALSAAMMVREPCECGSETPRLRGYLSTRTPTTVSASLTHSAGSGPETAS